MGEEQMVSCSYVSFVSNAHQMIEVSLEAKPVGTSVIDTVFVLLFLVIEHGNLLLFIVSVQRVQSRQTREIDVVLDDHNVTTVIGVIQRASRIRDNHSFHAQELKHPDGKGHLQEGKMEKGKQEEKEDLSEIVKN